ncbi:MAG: hypothetical protein ACOZE5_15730 [Verrucomicrobiota bacterium]
MRTIGHENASTLLACPRHRVWKPGLLLPCLLVLSLLGGCTSYEARVERGRNLAGLRSFFVIGNANDSRGIEHRIVAALRARGLEAAAGPHTMLPGTAQAIVVYQDRWAWDFGERLVYLQISVRDTRSPQPIAAATFSAKIPGRQSPAGIVDELVARLLAEGKPETR